MELTFRLAINLDLDEKDPFHFILEPDAVELPFAYDARTRDLLVSYRERRVREQLALPGWEAPTGKKRRGTVEALVDLNKRLHECIGYERREEGEALSPRNQSSTRSVPPANCAGTQPLTVRSHA